MRNFATYKLGVMRSRVSLPLPLLLLLLLSLPVVTRGATVQGNAPAAVSVGERFQLTYTVDDNAQDIALPDTEGFQVLMGPSASTQTSYSIVNGHASSSRQTIFTYILKATEKGSFTIAPARVTVGGQQVQSNPITIHVVSGDDPSSGGGYGQGQGQGSGQASGQGSGGVASQATGGDLFLVQSLSKGQVYEGEAVQLVTKVYTRVNLNSLTDKKDPKLTDFIVSDLTQQNITFQNEVYNGQQYQVAIIDRKVLLPQKSGRMTIDPTEAEFVVKRRVRGGGGGFFSDFFDDVQMTRQRVRSRPVQLTVKALPNKPAGFSGGVGRYTLKATVTPTEVEVDNSLQVKVTVEGTGNLKLLSMPKPQFHQDFDSFDPSSRNDVQNCSEGFTGRRTDEYVVIPRRDGSFEIPQIRLIYFDPSRAQYVTQTQGPWQVTVKKGSGAGRGGQGGGVVFNGSGPEQVTYTGGDLRWLHRSEATSEKGRFFVLSPLFWALTLLPALVVCALFVVYRKRVQDNANMSLVRSRKANKMARRRLKQAAKYMGSGEREAFFDEVMRALWGYLSDKLTLPLSELTKDNAREKMSQHGISAEKAEAFMGLLDECEFARYAPTAATATPEDVYNRAAQLIGDIEG